MSHSKERSDLMLNVQFSLQYDFEKADDDM
jgi:hypothetical protein